MLGDPQGMLEPNLIAVSVFIAEDEEPLTNQRRDRFRPQVMSRTALTSESAT